MRKPKLTQEETDPDCLQYRDECSTAWVRRWQKEAKKLSRENPVDCLSGKWYVKPTTEFHDDETELRQ